MSKVAKVGVSESLETVARLLDLVPFLSTHQGIALSELASEFSISPEQMSQDLNTLWMCGLPGYTPYELIDLSFDTGFVTISNAETLENPRTLSRDEALALLLGLESLNEEVKDSKNEVRKVLLSLITRLSDILGQDVAARVQMGDTSSGEMLAKIKSAIDNRFSLRVRYHSQTRDEITDRLLLPLEILEDDGKKYLLAFCSTSDGYRTFRLERILNAEIEEATVLSNSVAEVKSDPKIKVAIRVNSRLRDVHERLAPLGSSKNVEFECFSQEWAVREVMSFGGAITVTSPENLKKAVAERSRRTLAGYSTNF